MDSLNGATLLYAASKGREKIVSFLLSCGADPNSADKLGATPLHRASGPGHSGVVRLLLGEDSLVVDWAVSRGHTDLASWLLERNKDVDAEDEAGWTPLIIASSAGHEMIVRMLIEAGAGVNRTTKEGRSALLYAASKGEARGLSAPHQSRGQQGSRQ